MVIAVIIWMNWRKKNDFEIEEISKDILFLFDWAIEELFIFR